MRRHDFCTVRLCRPFKLILTSPLDKQRIDVHQSGQYLERQVESGLVSVQRDHHGALESAVRKASIAALNGVVVLVEVENRLERFLLLLVFCHLDVLLSLICFFLHIIQCAR